MRHLKVQLIFFHRSSPRLFSTNVRLNEVGIQMLPENLKQAVFPGSTDTLVRADPQIVQLSKEHLLKNELPINAVRKPLDNVNVSSMPPIQGGDIEEHFWDIGGRLGADYLRLAHDFASNHSSSSNFGSGHFKWRITAGWTKYCKDTGEFLGGVDFPCGDVLIFDVETCKAFAGGQAPVVAVAMSQDYLFMWLSPHFLADSTVQGDLRPEYLIPLGPRRAEQLIVGHNVSFDRARISEEYNFDVERNGRRFLDTLSMHSAVGGISSQQRIQWTKYKKERDTSDKDGTLSEELEVSEGQDCEVNAGEQSTASPGWCEKGSMANLADAVRLHCNGMILDKAPREMLWKEPDIAVIKANLPMILDYCANDVAATAVLFKALWPKFLKKCPHPVTFMAMLEMTTCFLPVTREWNVYLERCEAMLEEAKRLIEDRLAELAEKRRQETPSDPWLEKLDWTPTPARYTKSRYKTDGSFAKGGEPRPIGNEALFGMPAWFKKLYNARLEKVELTTKARIVPYLLKMKWEGCPVHYIVEHGWCYEEGDKPDPCHMENGKSYHKIPHAKEQGANVGCLLSKDYLAAFEKGVLTTESDDAADLVKKVLELNTRFSFWTGYRERVKEQMVVWQDGEMGVILPQCIPMGTVTRRAVESTWMTASNPKANLVGSELKAMIQAPPGYSIVGADVDSQELWIASLLGDAQFGLIGGTAVSWMTLQGTKADGTDLHSKTATLLGMTRDAAKIFTYGRIYGAGAKYAAQLLQKYDPTLDAKAAADKARMLYHATKGRKHFPSRRTYDQKDAYIYVGGSESFMFNQLESIAKSEVSRTPALGASISDALLSTTVQEEYLTSRVNWAVQSSGVDYLHMLLASMKYLMGLYGIRGRLLLTIHDEVRYLVPEEDQYRLAACLQIANLWTRAMFVHRLGMRDLPLSVAFFSAVDFDRVLRKEPTVSCQTPSHPDPIPSGHSLDIHQLLEKIKDGHLGPVDQDFVAWFKGRSLLSPKPRDRYFLLPHNPVDNVEYLRTQADIKTIKAASKYPDYVKKPAERVPALKLNGSPPPTSKYSPTPSLKVEEVRPPPNGAEMKSRAVWERLLKKTSNPTNKP